MQQTSRIKINLTSREFEVEGTEAFVLTYSTKIAEFLDLFSGNLGSKAGSSTASMPVSGTIPEATRERPIDQIPETFGEYFFSVPKDASGNDQILVAGHFAQMNSDYNSFATGVASDLLLDQGIKLANPSKSISRNLDAKYLIKLTKGKFRVSRDGIEHIKGILGGASNS